MHLAEMGPNAIIRRDTDIGSRDIDWGHDWIGEARKHYLQDDLLNVHEFLQQASSSDRNNSTITEEDFAENEYENLNEMQKTIFKKIEDHYYDTISEKHVEPLRMLIMGTAGTGKSYLIKAVRSRLHTMAGNEAESPVLVIAPTGVAAFNINGATIHSKLSVPISKDKKYNLEGKRLKQLQERLKDVKYFIIDEKSMVGKQMLGIIDTRLKQAFPEKINEPFGGRSVIMFGDFGQLPPVLDLPMYVEKPSTDEMSNKGKAAYRNFSEVYKLSVIQRQSGESEEQRDFRDLLLRLREGESSLKDWETLTKRFEVNLSQSEQDRFKDAVFIQTIWDDVNKVNIEMLRGLNQPVAKIEAVHTGGSQAKRANSDTAMGLEPQLLLARGCRIMLTTNLWTEAGLVNGSMGIVYDILFEEQGPPVLPKVIFVKFDQYTGPTISNLEGEKVVPISPIKRSWEKNGTTCSRLQLPICLAWAITVHKSQGLTLEKANIDIGTNEFAAGLTFVAISRVRSLNNICLKPFSFDRLQLIKNHIRLQERKKEEKRLLSTTT